MIFPPNFETKVGFDRVRLMLKERCLSSLGEGRVDEMEFSTDASEVEERIGRVDEFVRLLAVDANEFPAQYFFDLRSSLRRVRTEGLYLDVHELFDLWRSLSTLHDVVRLLVRQADEERPAYPRLRRLAADVAVFPRFTERIAQLLSPYGEVKDSASPELSDIRRSLASTRGSISRLLTNILRQAQAEGLVSKDTAPTMRDGRLVIPVAPALKRRIAGIVHDESASGKTVYIEPAEVVEANNRVRELEGEERREIVRLLTAFTDSLRPHIPELLLSYEFLADVDFIRAKALCAEQMGGIAPQLSREPLIDWIRAVHPLLQLTLGRQGKQAVPLDITLDAARRILIISGPNAGGKSVCLKTVGLLQYMWQCGLLVPMREGSRAGLFDDLFIDIGDEQSIDDDLSTYSSHLNNMKQTMRHCGPRSLVLIDEFGGGTEPRIGGAIAEAVLKQLNESRVYGVITTHYHNLKTFAENHEGVVNGAMLYDRRLMRPLFEMQMGRPGSSFAIEIARKIGLPDYVIRDAEAMVGSDYINADKYLQDIVRDKRYYENKRQQIHHKEKQLDETLAACQAEADELKRRKREVMEQAREEARQLLSQANAQIENTIRGIKEAQAEREQTKALRAEFDNFRRQVEEEAREKAENEALVSRKMEQIRSRQQRRTERRKRAKNEAETRSNNASKPREDKPEVGSAVRIKGQIAVGSVLELTGKRAIVAMGNVKTTVDISRLEPVDKAVVEKAERARQATTFVGRATQEQMRQKQLHFNREIDVRGMRGDEALQAVTYFIDDAIQVGAERVRILHGTGNGILRTLIRQYLQTATGVKHFADEHVQLGGAGITVVELA